VARADFGYFLVLGLFGVAAVQGSYYYSIARLGVGLAILLQYVAPSLIVLWDLVRGRRPAPAMVVAVVLALAGTALLVRGVDPRTLHASARDWAIGMSSAVIFAFYVVYSKRGLARYAPETVLFYTFVIAAGFWAVVTPPWRIIAAHYSAALWTRFALLGVFSTLVPFRCFYAGLKRLPATEAGVISTSEPVVAVLSAALFLGESLRPMQLAGAGLVIGAALLASRDHPETVAASVERS
jgi:drug/metabolite transporter (DMT)-like permease